MINRPNNFLLCEKIMMFLNVTFFQNIENIVRIQK